MIDAHAHLQLEPLRSQFDDLHARAQAANVTRMILVGVDLDSSKKAIELSALHADLHATVGVHPSDGVKNGIGELDTEQGRAEFTNLLQQNKVCAIGEAGLDYHWIDKNDAQKRKQQWDMFIFQIQQSKKYALPLIIHSREAGEDTLAILREHEPCRALMHCFSYDEELAADFLSLNPKNKIAFTGIVTFPSAKEIQQTARSVDLERMLTESDCPYLAPQKYRGQQNEPAYIAEIVAKIAELKGISFDEVDRQTESNAIKFFGLS